MGIQQKTQKQKESLNTHMKNIRGIKYSREDSAPNSSKKFNLNFQWPADCLHLSFKIWICRQIYLFFGLLFFGHAFLDCCCFFVYLFADMMLFFHFLESAFLWISDLISVVIFPCCCWCGCGGGFCEGAGFCGSGGFLQWWLLRWWFLRCGFL